MNQFKGLKIIYFALFTAVFFTICNSCSNDDSTVNCLPNVNVAAQYNLSFPAYNNLLYVDGYYEFPADGTNGSRGVIVVNTGSGYAAYDRNAPHICPTANSTLVVEDGIKLVCPEDGAEWILRTGQPLNDITDGRSPRRFYTSVSNNILIITY